jgi:hypothetical protein
MFWLGKKKKPRSCWRVGTTWATKVEGALHTGVAAPLTAGDVAEWALFPGGRSTRQWEAEWPMAAGTRQRRSGISLGNSISLGRRAGDIGHGRRAPGSVASPVGGAAEGTTCEG